jgi:ATP-dependent Clp protease ATP-binding subunit ClpX
VIEVILRDVMFDIPSRTDVREIVVTTESVENGTTPLLMLRPEPARKEA